MPAPAEIRAYLKRLVERVSAAVGDHIAGVYLIGSLVLDDYRPTWSDIDVYVLQQGDSSCSS